MTTCDSPGKQKIAQGSKIQSNLCPGFLMHILAHSRHHSAKI
jgi:hypothetical protein